MEACARGREALSHLQQAEHHQVDRLEQVAGKVAKVDQARVDEPLDKLQHEQPDLALGAPVARARRKHA